MECNCRSGYTRTKGYTRGGTTSQSKNPEDNLWKTNAKGVEVNITPKTLIVNRKSEDKKDDTEKTSKPDLNFLISIDQPGSDATNDKVKDSKAKAAAKDVTES